MTLGAKFKEYAGITFGTAIIAIAVYFFMLPSHVSVGSVSALAMVMSNFISLPVSMISLIMNLLLMVLGFFLIDSDFGFKTVYGTVLLPLLLLGLTIPQEVLASRAGLAETLLLPGRYAPAGLQMLLHCLLLICLFLAIGGALHLAGEVACAPLSRPVRWLPHAALTLLTLTQLLRRETLRQALAALSFGALLLLAAVVLLFIPARRRRP